MKKILILTAILTLAVSLMALSACGINLGGDFINTPNTSENYTNNNGDDGIDDLMQDIIQEGDIVKTYGNYLLVMSEGKAFIVYSDQGNLTLVGDKSGNGYDYENMLIYGDTLIMTGSKTTGNITDNSKVLLTNYVSVAEFYDLSTLTQEENSFEFNTVEVLRVPGKIVYESILSGRLAFITTFYGIKLKPDNDFYVQIEVSGEAAEITGEYVASTDEYEDNYSLILSKSLNVEGSSVYGKAYYGEMTDLNVYSDAYFPTFASAELVLNDEDEIEEEEGEEEAEGNLEGTEEEIPVGPVSGKLIRSRIIIKLNPADLNEIGRVSIESETIINRFAVNYNDGYLYVVSYSKEEASTALRIYDQSMMLTGSITGIAPGEQLKSSAYDSEYCYIVTFRNVDPVFKIDITNPSEPILVDELIIPGYSTYLRTISDNRAIGIGEGEVNDVFSFGKINLYDTDSMTILSEFSSSLTFLPLYYSDMQSLYFDNNRSWIIMSGLGFVEDEKEGNSGKSLNVLIVSYEDDILTLVNYFSFPIEDYETFDETYNLRCFVMEDVLYIINNHIRTYNINSDYELIDTLTLE
jgi:hypothetical protein